MFYYFEIVNSEIHRLKIIIVTINVSGKASSFICLLKDAFVINVSKSLLIKNNTNIL